MSLYLFSLARQNVKLQELKLPLSVEGVVEEYRLASVLRVAEAYLYGDCYLCSHAVSVVVNDGIRFTASSFVLSISRAYTSVCATLECPSSLLTV